MRIKDKFRRYIYSDSEILWTELFSNFDLLDYVVYYTGDHVSLISSVPVIRYSIDCIPHLYLFSPDFFNLLSGRSKYVLTSNWYRYVAE